MFKITFNKPASKAFFEGEDAEGIRVKIENGAVLFKAVPKIGPDDKDVVPVTERVRGGVQAYIEGSQAGALLKLLTNPLGYPFYTIKRRANGWMEAVAHTGPKFEPERWEPHIRVWPREGSATATDANMGELDLRGPGHAKFVQPDPTPETDPNHVRDNLRKLEDSVKGLAEVPFGLAYSKLTEVQKLMQIVLNPLQAVATEEAQMIRDARPRRRVSQTDVHPTVIQSAGARPRRHKVFA